MSSNPPLSPAAAAKQAEVEAHALPQPVSASPSTTISAKDALFPNGLRAYFMADVDPDLSTLPLIAYCFMTGYIDAISFSAIFVWCAFQTGNTVQLALALARLFEGPPGDRDETFHLPDKQALTSVLTFLFGAFLGRIGDRVGARTRAWLFAGTFTQALFTMAGAIALWKSGQGSIGSTRGDPSWTNASTFACLGLISASMGLQGIMGKRVNTQFTTTIVLTTVWCELMADPKLFVVNRWVTTRDHKVLAIGALFLGGFASRAILQSIGSPAALGIGTGLRVAIALSWLFVPAKVAKSKK